MFLHTVMSSNTETDCECCQLHRASHQSFNTISTRADFRYGDQLVWARSLRTVSPWLRPRSDWPVSCTGSGWLCRERLGRRSPCESVSCSRQRTAALLSTAGKKRGDVRASAEAEDMEKLWRLRWFSLKITWSKKNFSRWIKLFPWYRNVEHGTPQGCERRPFLFNLLTRTSAAQHLHRWVSGDWDKSETSGRGEVGRAVSRITTAPEPPPAHGGVSSTYILSESLTRHIQHRMHFL